MISTEANITSEPNSEYLKPGFESTEPKLVLLNGALPVTSVFGMFNCGLISKDFACDSNSSATNCSHSVGFDIRILRDRGSELENVIGMAECRSPALRSETSKPRPNG